MADFCIEHSGANTCTIGRSTLTSRRFRDSAIPQFTGRNSHYLALIECKYIRLNTATAFISSRLRTMPSFPNSGTPKTVLSMPGSGARRMFFTSRRLHWGYFDHQVILHCWRLPHKRVLASPALQLALIRLHASSLAIVTASAYR